MKLRIQEKTEFYLLEPWFSIVSLKNSIEKRKKNTLARFPSLPLKIEDPPFRMLVLSPCTFPCDSSGAVDVGLVSIGISSDKICLQHQLAKSGYFFPVSDKLLSRQQEQMNWWAEAQPRAGLWIFWLTLRSFISPLSQLHATDTFPKSVFVAIHSPIWLQKFGIWET